eukprot:SAG22_NODE_7439_length_740_cov_0.879875_1_plen_49_part_10
MYLLECGKACGGLPVDVSFSNCSVLGGGGGFLFDGFAEGLDGRVSLSRG